jgi:hypothetical protein
MYRRGLMTLVAGLAVAGFAAMRAETADAKTKPNGGCACCGAACECGGCICDASATPSRGCPCCGGATCCPAESEATPPLG